MYWSSYNIRQPIWLADVEVYYYARQCVASIHFVNFIYFTIIWKLNNFHQINLWFIFMCLQLPKYSIYIVTSYLGKPLKLNLRRIIDLKNLKTRLKPPSYYSLHRIIVSKRFLLSFLLLSLYWKRFRMLSDIKRIKQIKLSKYHEFLLTDGSHSRSSH